MSTEKNKAIMRRWLEEMSKGNLFVLDEVVAPDYTRHAAATETQGREGYRQLLKTFDAGFSDIQIDISEMITEGDKVAVHYTTRLRHVGEFMGIAPTGRQVKVTSTAIVRFADDKAVESWANLDMFSLMQQLGAAS